MGSGSIAGQIAQCNLNIGTSQEKIARLEKEISELTSVKASYNSTLTQLEDDYDGRVRRLGNISRSYQKAKGGRTYHEGMEGDLPTYKTKITSLSSFVEKVGTDITNKQQELDQERTYLSQLNGQRDSLQIQYNQAVWDEEQERIKNQAIWDAQQNNNKP